MLVLWDYGTCLNGKFFADFSGNQHDLDQELAGFLQSLLYFYCCFCTGNLHLHAVYANAYKGSKREWI